MSDANGRRELGFEEIYNILSELELVEKFEERGEEFLVLTEKFYEMFEVWFRERNGNLDEALIMTVLTACYPRGLEQDELVACVALLKLILQYAGEGEE